VHTCAIASVVIVLGLLGSHCTASLAAATEDPVADADAIVMAFARLPTRAGGNFVDPVSNMGAPPYSQATFGAAALWLAQRTGNAEEAAFGERMLAHVAANPPSGSVFELGAAAEGYSLLPPASPVRPALAGWLRSAAARTCDP
jgi:hypothetical protein